MISLCRACLAEVDSAEMRSFYDAIQDYSIDPNNIFSILTAIELDHNDYNVFPQMVCNECADKFELIISFRMTCIQSNQWLEEQLEPGNLTKDPLSESTILKIQMEADQHESFEEPDNYSTGTIDSSDELSDMLFKPSHYECDICAMIFFEKSLIKTHLQQHCELKIHVQCENPHVCETCGQSFKTKWLLSAHSFQHSNSVYPCNFCESFFRNKSTLQRHTRTVHYGYKPYACTYCNQTFAKHDTLKHHVMRHTGEKPHSCHMCDRRFIQLVALRRHIQTHNRRGDSKQEALKDPKPKDELLLTESHYKCEICNKSFYSKQSIKVHLSQYCGINKSSPTKSFVCGKCGKIFTRKSSLIEHTQTHHKSPDRHQFPCSLCEMRFISQRKLMLHMNHHININTFLCSICDVKTSTQKAMDRHIESHNTELNHACDKCDSKFRNKVTLDRHIRIVHYGYKPYDRQYCDVIIPKHDTQKKHNTMRDTVNVTNEPTYECSSCFKCFYQKSTLDKHLLDCSVESQLSTMGFTCKECGEIFTEECDLLAHITSHNTKFNHSCDRCGATFRKKSGLKRHTLHVHEGYKPYACRYCGQTFSKTGTRKHHEMRHTGERPHACQLCDRRFIQMVALRRHMETHTKQALKTR